MSLRSLSSAAVVRGVVDDILRDVPEDLQNDIKMFIHPALYLEQVQYCDVLKQDVMSKFVLREGYPIDVFSELNGERHRAGLDLLFEFYPAFRIGDRGIVSDTDVFAIFAPRVRVSVLRDDDVEHLISISVLSPRQIGFSRRPSGTKLKDLSDE